LAKASLILSASIRASLPGVSGNSMANSWLPNRDMMSEHLVVESRKSPSERSTASPAWWPNLPVRPW
jgi:hypothetical protein